MRVMYEVVRMIVGAHPIHKTYPLLKGDLLHKNEDGTWTKEAPGLTIGGFVLTEEQQKRLKQVNIESHGLLYWRTK